MYFFVIPDSRYRESIPIIFPFPPPSFPRRRESRAPTFNSHETFIPHHTHKSHSSNHQTPKDSLLDMPQGRLLRPAPQHPCSGSPPPRGRRTKKSIAYSFALPPAFRFPPPSFPRRRESRAQTLYSHGTDIPHPTHKSQPSMNPNQLLSHFDRISQPPTPSRAYAASSSTSPCEENSSSKIQETNRLLCC